MKRLSLIVLALSLATTAYAQQRKAAPRKQVSPAKKQAAGVKKDLSGTNKGPYGMAGCGLGSLIFADSENRASQVFAATTNGSYWNNSFGATSGTSNCIPDNGRTADVKKNVNMFVAANREALANDVVKSDGETIVAVSNLMGCKDASYLGAKLQSRYETIFNSREDAVVANNMYDTVSSDSYLVENCKL